MGGGWVIGGAPDAVVVCIGAVRVAGFQATLVRGLDVFRDEAKGCLEGVDEIYGYHTHHRAVIGHLWCIEGATMSMNTSLFITITGTSGHGSHPEHLKVAIWKGIEFYQKFHAFIQKEKT